ncbi:MAG: transcription antitermination factor NusB [Akkermansiaceae bacterium]
MLKRRNIRETAIQYLYFQDLQTDNDISAVEDTFWDICQETSVKKLNHARAKAILHVAQGREPKFDKLQKLAPLDFATLKSIPNAEALSVALKRITTQQNLLNKSIENLKSALVNKGQEELPVQLIDEVIKSNGDIAKSHQAWHDTLLGFPQLKNKFEATTATISHLAKSSSRFDAIEDQDSALTDFAHLRASNSEILISRQQVKELVSQVLQHQEELDSIMTHTIENYRPERVNLVDRAILRLAIYEMKYCEDIPRSVSINEAIEIAKRFGTTDSSSFINGVLDAVK